MALFSDRVPLLNKWDISLSFLKIEVQPTKAQENPDIGEAGKRPRRDTPESTTTPAIAVHWPPIYLPGHVSCTNDHTDECELGTQGMMLTTNVCTELDGSDEETISRI
jgi:hypothetical protein